MEHFKVQVIVEYFDRNRLILQGNYFDSLINRLVKTQIIGYKQIKISN